MLLCIKIKCKDTSAFFFHAISLPFEHVSDTQSQKEQGGREVMYFFQNKLVPILCVHRACEVKDYFFPHSVLEIEFISFSAEDKCVLTAFRL